MNAPAWFSDEALRKRASVVPAIEERAWGALGAIMSNLLAPPAESGPPYTHTLAPPPEPWYSKTGKLVYRPPVPHGFTMSGPGVGHGTPPPHSAPRISLAVGDDLGPPDEFRWTPDEDDSEP